MKKKIGLFSSIFFFVPMFLLAQTATIKGITLDGENNPVSGVNIRYEGGATVTNANGFYSLKLPSQTPVTLIFSHVGFKESTYTFLLKENEIFEFNPILGTRVEQIEAVVITSANRDHIEGIVSLSPEAIRKIPGANAGVENLLQTLPGVNSNNELSTQYAVRGGNYDENLVYVNGIEVYRPFLIRSGQQEGLSFVNADLVRDVDFSAGGFQAKYGDKLSSVLDITYRRPVSFGASADLSLLGASLSAEGISKDQKFSAILGARYRDNSLLVDAKQTETNFRPRFYDLQSYLTYTFSDKFELGFLGNLSRNRYDYEPLTRQTNFGTLADPKALVVYYSGSEKDQYDTYFGAFKGTYKATENLRLEGNVSVYQTQEQEHYDISAEYFLGTPNTSIGDANIGEVQFIEGIGSQLTHARNDLDALIINIQHRGTYKIGDGQLDWGLKYTHEDIRDRLQEYEVIDSAGFSIRPPRAGYVNDQPYTPFEAPLVPFTNVRAKNDVQVNRVAAFGQYARRIDLGNAEGWYNLGLRAQQWQVSGQDINTVTQTLISPRAQFSIKPAWREDMVFRLATGIYQQPPFYRELRDSLGQVRPAVKAQKSLHLVAGQDWSFKLWDRPFKLVSEAYYKNMWDVNPYTLENVRIRYRARNNAKAYAYGLDVRMAGEFVPGTESWISLGYLKTQENIEGRGYIDRPTDQRLKIGFLFQDYVPTIQSLRLYLNMVYQSGLPGGSPSYADPYNYQLRLPFYFRADAGFSYVFTDGKKNYPQGHWLHAFKELSAGFEIYNIFDRQNSITNTFVRDVSTKMQYAIPNYLSPRVFNIRVSARF